MKRIPVSQTEHGPRQSVRRSFPGGIAIWAIGLLGVLLLLWVWFMVGSILQSDGPNGQAFSVDFSHTYAASLVLEHGGNPYDYHQLTRVQHEVMAAAGLPVEPATPAVRVGTSAFFLWLFRPLTFLPYQTAAVVWMLATYLLSAVGFLAILRYLGWRRRVVPALVFLSLPQVLLAAYYGNTICLVFFGIACAFPLLQRYPVLAGMLLSLAMFKPPAAAPIALLVILFQAPRKRLTTAGFALAYLARQAVTMVLVGSQYEWWHIEGFLGFSNSIQLQPNLISLSGLYSDWVPHLPRMGMEMATIAAALALTVAYWLRLGRPSTVPILTSAPLWCVWLVATPYAHFVDETLLVIPIVAMLGRDACRLTEPLSLAVVYLLVLSLSLFSWSPYPAQLLWVPLLAMILPFRAAARGSAAVRERAPAALGLDPITIAGG